MNQDEERVTINITKDNFPAPDMPLFGSRPIIAKLKFLKKKNRWYGEMRLTGSQNGAHTYTIFPFYNPTPKSQLRVVKSKFTKNKFKLQNKAH